MDHCKWIFKEAISIVGEVVNSQIKNFSGWEPQTPKYASSLETWEARMDIVFSSINVKTCAIVLTNESFIYISNI